MKFIIKWIESNAVKHATNDAKIDCGKFIFIEGLFIRSYVEYVYIVYVATNII